MAPTSFLRGIYGSCFLIQDGDQGFPHVGCVQNKSVRFRIVAGSSDLVLTQINNFKCLIFVSLNLLF